eukprot:14654640-Alexandrium_andersonii.AAC.1
MAIVATDATAMDRRQWEGLWRLLLQEVARAGDAIALDSAYPEEAVEKMVNKAIASFKKDFKPPIVVKAEPTEAAPTMPVQRPS